MVRRSPDAPCPCGSGRKYKRCCRRFHQGKLATTPEELMRSRWSAYAAGEVNYIIETTDPEGPQAKHDRTSWAAEIAAFSAHTRFEKLEIRACSPVVDDRGEVTFHAKLSREGQDVSFTECSEFVRREGRWLYRRAIS